MKRKLVDLVLGDALVLTISPRSVTYHVGTRRPLADTRRNAKERRSLLRRALRPFRILRTSSEPFFIPARAYPTTTALADLAKYHEMADVVACGEMFTQSMRYRRLMDELSANGVARYKRGRLESQADIVRHFEAYLLPLIADLRHSGFDRTKGDLPTVLIGADGRIDKAGSGDHRFYLAQILKLPACPVRVRGAHADWLHDTMGTNRPFDAIRKGLHDVEYTHRPGISALTPG